MKTPAKILALLIIITVLIILMWPKKSITPAPIQMPVENQASETPLTCVSAENGAPTITSLSPQNAKIGETITITGCNLAGFEGDLTVWLENSAGEKGILPREKTSTTENMTIILPAQTCQTDNSYSGEPCAKQLTISAGAYKVWTEPWGKKSNTVNLFIN